MKQFSSQNSGKSSARYNWLLSTGWATGKLVHSKEKNWSTSGWKRAKCSKLPQRKSFSLFLLPFFCLSPCVALNYRKNRKRRRKLNTSLTSCHRQRNMSPVFRCLHQQECSHREHYWPPSSWNPHSTPPWDAFLSRPCVPSSAKPPRALTIGETENEECFPPQKHAKQLDQHFMSMCHPVCSKCRVSQKKGKKNVSVWYASKVGKIQLPKLAKAGKISLPECN